LSIFNVTIPFFMKKIHLKNISAVLFILLSFPGTHSFAQVGLNEPIPVTPDVKIGKLANGLTYYIWKNSKPEQKAELRLVVKAGSILEDDDQQGLAHFTEHMGFNGTRHFKKNELVSFLQSMGVKFGADLNAYTSFNETVYILPIPTDKKENLEKGFTVLEDWASTMTFENAEIDKERGVVLEESRLGKGANDRMNRLVVYPKLFEGSRYADRLPIGKDDILKTFKYDAAKRFYHDWYRPDLMAVIAAGDIDPAETEKMIKEHFGKLKNPAPEKPRVQAEMKPRQNTEAAIASDKEATRSLLYVYYPVTKAKDEVTLGDYRESTVKNIFNSLLGDRFQELTQKPNPPFVFGGSSLGAFQPGYEVFSGFALIGKDGPEPAITALIQENERARKFGFTEAELDRTKKDQLKSIEQYNNEHDKRESASIAQELIRNFLVREPIPGSAKEFAYAEQFLPTITLDEINRYAAQVIPSGSKVIVLTTPEKTDFALPTKEQLIGYADNAAKATITAYEEKAVASSLITTPPVAGKIISEKENKELGFTEVNLSNGVKVILKSTDFKNDQVLLSGFRYGGQSLYGNEDRFNAEFAAQIVSQLGIGSFSPVDIGKVLAGKSVSVNPRISMLSEGVSGQSSATDVEALLQLVWLYFTQPRQDDDLFKSFISKQQAQFQNVFSDPQTIFSDTLLKVTYGHNLRGPHIPRAENFASINEQRALAIYKERFGDANGFTFIILGKIDLTALRPLIATYLASLPSNGRTSMFKDLGIRPIKGVVKMEVHKGSEPKSLINLQYTGEAPYSYDEQLKLQALMEVLNIKIIETLREEMSGIYGGRISGSLTKNPYNNFSIGVNLPCGPENVDKLLKAALAEIEKVKTAGPQETDLKKVKENWKKQYEENMKSNPYWLAKLQQIEESNTTASDILNYEKKVDALTIKELRETANKYLNGQNYIQAILYPEK
jgi:zinc protease